LTLPIEEIATLPQDALTMPAVEFTPAKNNFVSKIGALFRIASPTCIVSFAVASRKNLRLARQSLSG
jgi:hypothetical protein